MRCLRCRKEGNLFWCKTLTGITIVACRDCIARHKFIVIEPVKVEKRNSVNRKAKTSNKG
jgi:Zn-finger protein